MYLRRSTRSHKEPDFHILETTISVRDPEEWYGMTPSESKRDPGYEAMHNVEFLVTDAREESYDIRLSS